MDTKQDKQFRAKVLSEALPYIQDYNGKIVVVKYGGNAMTNQELKMSVMHDIVLLNLIGVKVVLVHGGGPEISEMLKDHDHVIITNHGRGESVLINIEDYAKYEEFLHQRYVAEALAKAKQQAADPDTQWEDHESVWETLSKQYDV